MWVATLALKAERLEVSCFHVEYAISNHSLRPATKIKSKVRKKRERYESGEVGNRETVHTLPRHRDFQSKIAEETSPSRHKKKKGPTRVKSLRDTKANLE